jgi:hypothetical protein
VRRPGRALQLALLRARSLGAFARGRADAGEGVFLLSACCAALDDVMLDVRCAFVCALK